MRRLFLSALLSLALAVPCSASPAPEHPQWTNAFGMSFRLIPAGKSVIGRYGWAGVDPRREVTLSRDFGMGTTEVTQAQWKAVMGGTNPSEPFHGDDLPVNRVSWHDAQAFVRKLNELDAPRRYRLPTSAEWEHAYRAGSHATWITGDGTPAFPDSLREYEWFGPGSTTHPVAQKKPNNWGLYDMGGNVREWVQDFWQHDYYSSMPASDPNGPEAGTLRVWRGGSYEDPLDACSCASRDGSKPTARNKWTGFRVVLEGESLKAELGNALEGKAATQAEATSARAAQPAPSSAVRIRWADEALKGALSHESFVASTGLPQIEVAICANNTVRNIKVLKLDFVSVDENGKPHFNSTELFHKDTLEQRHPLILAIPLFENIPQYGISYEDGGNVLRFGITQSGKDGSLELMPF